MTILSRRRLLRGATAMLYIGPLFGGMIGLDWTMVPAFLAIFVVWLMILRPEQWPANPEEWLTLPAWASALTQVLAQLLLVCVLLGVGRGIGAVAGFIPPLNPYRPLSMSFFAIPLCRILWDPESAGERGVFLDDEAAELHATRAQTEARAAVHPLLRFDDKAPEAVVGAAVAETLGSVDAGWRLQALVEALTRPDRSHLALRRALVLWATDPEVVTSRVPDGMLAAFTLAGGRADLLRLYLPRALAMITAFPALAPDFPAPADLHDLARSQGDDLVKTGLLDLASAVEKVQANRA